MHHRFLLIPFFIVMACTQRQNKIMLEDKGILKNYQMVKGWPNLPPGYAAGSPVGIGIDSNQHIFIFSRAGREWTTLVPMPSTPISGRTILEIDKNTGKLINSWGDHFFIMPHGLTVDDEDNIWVTDVGLQQVFKFTHEGRLLMALGEAGKPGNDPTHFNMPTGVAVAKDGSFYVSDGYGNSRIVHFSAEGKYLFEWGKKGSGEGEFNIPHAVELDDSGLVYVADRENQRIQVFNIDGKFIKMLSDKSFGNLCSMVFDKQLHRIIAVDDLNSFDGLVHKGSDIIVFDAGFISFTRLGRTGGYDGPVCWYHDLAVDREGSIYTLDLLENRIQKFEQKNP